MKVLFLDQFADLGGAQQCLLGLIPAFRNEGWEVVAGLPGDGPLAREAAGAGASIERLPEMRYSAGKKSVPDLARFAASLPELARTIARLVARHAPTLLYINGPRLLPAAAWQAEKRCPVVFHSHHYLGKRYATQLAGRSIIRLAATVIGCCDFVCSQWRPFVPEPRLHRVYNGVRAPQFRARDVAAPPVVGIVGRIAPEKGQHVFVEMARALGHTRPVARFEIFGDALFQDAAAERYRDSVASAAAGLPIRFTGWHNDVDRVYEDLDVLVVPSTAPEATTRVIPEAWAAGAPVVATALGGIAEIVRDGENGFLVSEPKAELFAKRVAEVLALPTGQRRTVIQAGLESYQRRFTLDRYCSEILSICSRL